MTAICLGYGDGLSNGNKRLVAIDGPDVSGSAVFGAMDYSYRPAAHEGSLPLDEAWGGLHPFACA